MSYDMPIMLDKWRSKQDVLVVNLDDYNIIFGLDSLRKNKIVLMSYLNRVMTAVRDDYVLSYVAMSQR